MTTYRRPPLRHRYVTTVPPSTMTSQKLATASVSRTRPGLTTYYQSDIAVELRTYCIVMTLTQFLLNICQGRVFFQPSSEIKKADRFI